MVNIDRTPFAPVTQRPRRDGWTPEVQMHFIAALAACGSVSDACRNVGRSRKSAYALRHRPDAAGFAAAWKDAVSTKRHRPAEHAVEDLEGMRVPVFHRGRVVGTRTSYDNRLLMLMLRARKLSSSDRRGLFGLSHPGFVHDS